MASPRSGTPWLAWPRLQPDLTGGQQLLPAATTTPEQQPGTVPPDVTVSKHLDSSFDQADSRDSLPQHTSFFMSFMPLALLLTACSPSADSGAAQPLTEDFSGDAAGWIVADFVSETDYTLDGPTYEPIWSAEDGGSIGFKDLEHLSFFFDAPEDWLGDLSAFEGGTLSWSAKTNINDWQLDQWVVIDSPAGVLYTPIDSYAELDAWVERSVSLDTATDWRLDAPAGAAATDAEIAAVLAEITGLMLPGESAQDLVETSQIDTIRLDLP